MFIRRTPGDNDIDALFKLLKSNENYQELSDLCKQNYVMPYFRVNYKLTLKHLSDANVPIEFKNIKGGYLL